MKLKQRPILQTALKRLFHTCPLLKVCGVWCVCSEGPAEPAERGHHVPEGEPARGAAALQAAVGRPGDGGDQAAQPDPAAPAGPRRLLHQEPGAPGRAAAKLSLTCRFGYHPWGTNNCKHCYWMHEVRRNSCACVLAVCPQIKLQECQKRMDELEAELQRANNKVCHTGHLLNQMTVKVKEILCCQPKSL